LNEGVKKRYPLKRRYFAAIGSSSVPHSGTPPFLVKGSRDNSVRSEGHADSRYAIVTVGLTRPTLHIVNYTTWSGVFNTLKFDHLLQKKKTVVDRYIHVAYHKKHWSRAF